MNNVLKEGLLLNEKGNLSECGYNTKLIKKYDRNQIKTSKMRIKEWDYYYVGDENYGIALTIDDNGYMGLVSGSVIDFKNKKHYNKANMFLFCFGKVNMPSTSETGNIKKSGKGYNAEFINENGKRHLKMEINNFHGKYFKADIILTPTTNHSMVIATPFKKKKHFYYNQKINNLKGEGEFVFGDLNYKFNDNAYGVLDWGRGVWTYSNTWYWSSLNGKYNNKIIGFNLGYGFGDTSAASENMLFVDKEVYKLDDVIFNIPKFKNGKENYLATWTITSKNNDINLIFEPILDRHDATNAIIISQDAHQVFGKFSGTFNVNGQIIEIKDMIGFAEKVKNRW